MNKKTVVKAISDQELETLFSRKTYLFTETGMRTGPVIPLQPEELLKIQERLRQADAVINCSDQVGHWLSWFDLLKKIVHVDSSEAAQLRFKELREKLESYRYAKWGKTE